MSEGPTPAPFLTALRDLVAWLERARVPGVVIGGVAASIQGRPRATRDLDVLALLEEEQWGGLLVLGAEFGYEPRIPEPLAFARTSRVLLLRHQPTAIDLDLTLGTLPFEEEAVRRAVRVDVGGLALPVASPEDLLIMKSVAHRPRDLVDIEAILDHHQRLDLARVHHWLREFSAALDMPEILDDFQRIARRRGRKS